MKRIRWDAVGVGVAVALAGIALVVPVPHARMVAVGLVVVGLLIAILGGVLQRRTEVTELISLKEEGTALLNRDPMTILKRGDEQDLENAVSVFRIAAALWLGDALPVLRRAGATDGEISDFTTIIAYAPAQPARNAEHAAVKGILAERLHRLRPIITRLEGEA